ncbi:MAG: methyltransferase [Clostridia bacterium]|nr:methyltransferase [Clostridia bacterium]
MLKEGEKIEPLGGGVKIIVSEEHKFWTDTVLLADFAAPKKNDKACDLGSGCGPIPLMWLRNSGPEHITAVEIQENACEMFGRSLAMNGFSDRVDIINSDLRDLKGKVMLSSYDLVVCNPPYKADGAGIRSSSKPHMIARHESMCTMNDIVAAARSLLNFSGRFCMCQRPERLSDVITAMRENDIEPKRLRFVQQRKTKAPKLFLIEGRRGGRPGGLVVEPVLFIENDSGEFSDEMIGIYGEYKEEYL